MRGIEPFGRRSLTRLARFARKSTSPHPKSDVSDFGHLHCRTREHPSSAGRGEKANPFSRRAPRPRLANHNNEKHLPLATHDPEKWRPVFGQDHAHEKGRRSAERRKFIGAAPHIQTSPLECAPQTSVRSLRHSSAYAAAGLAEPARLPALRGGSCRSDRTLRLSPGRASRDEVRRRYLRLWIALKRGTPRAGHSTGGNDARTARGRGYKPRPQEPHSPHPTAVTGRRP